MDKASLDQLKEKTARLSVISNSGLVLMKFIVGFALTRRSFSDLIDHSIPTQMSGGYWRLSAIIQANMPDFMT
jgi:divalent metal cation (Fe/Co/Zn/Cd) transporter